jgi:hypothetical protein
MDVIISKICSICGEEKTITEFYEQKSCKCGVRSCCKECDHSRNKKYQDEHVEELREKRKKHNEEHKEELHERARLKRLECPEKMKSWNLGRYGINLEEYTRMLEAQGGKCKICGGVPSARMLGVDHDHATSTIRGLLCGGCNSGIGYFQDNPSLLRKAADYLDKELGQV